MVEYDGSKCTPHDQTRCVTCMALAAKGKKPTAVSDAQYKKDWDAAHPNVTPPASMAGGPPPDIEGLGNVRDRVSEPVTQEETDYDRIVKEMNQVQVAAPDVLSAPYDLKGPGQSSGLHAYAESFETLPVDDSHTSKVVRAAAQYAKTTKVWAQTLAQVEKIKVELLKAEASLEVAKNEKEQAEQDLKFLVTGAA